MIAVYGCVGLSLLLLWLALASVVTYMGVQWTVNFPTDDLTAYFYWLALAPNWKQLDKNTHLWTLAGAALPTVLYLYVLPSWLPWIWRPQRMLRRPF